MNPEYLSSEPVTVIDPAAAASADPVGAAARATPVPPSAVPRNDGSCELCERVIPAGYSRVITSLKEEHMTEQKVCADCAEQVRRELEKEGRASGLLKPGLFGLGGALLGAGVWAAIAVAAELSVGYIAVLVGFLAGSGVKLGARGARGHSLQILAAALAVIGLVAAKYFTVAYVFASETSMSPFSGLVVSLFFEHFTELLSPFDILWLALAVGAAYRVPAPSVVHVESER